YHIVMESPDAKIVDSTLSLNDTTLQLDLLNTKDEQYIFAVELYSTGSGRSLLGKSTPASSIFVTTASSDQRIDLDWSDFSVPWNNAEYVIYREDPNTSGFYPIDTTTVASFSDKNLLNQQEYCYYIKTIGDLQLQSVPSPIINLSQRTC